MVLPVLQSSAPVGSSHSISLGCFASARAMATRCCSPPESCEGKLSIRSDSPTLVRTCPASSGSLQICVASSTFSFARQVGYKVVKLKNIADVIASIRRKLFPVQAAYAQVVHAHFPRRRSCPFRPGYLIPWSCPPRSAPRLTVNFPFVNRQAYPVRGGNH